MNLPVNIGVSGYYEVRLRRPDGRIVPFKGHEKPIKNIITNNGLDSVFTRTFLASMKYLVVGTGSTAAAVTDASLETYFATSSTISADKNGVTYNFADRYKENYRTWEWANSTGNSVTIYEIGITWLDTSNPAVFSRIVVGAGLTVPDGYSLVVKYTLRQYVPIWRTPATTSITVNGASQSGTLMLCNHYTAASDTTLSNMFSYPSATGMETWCDVYYRGLLEPSVISNNFYQQQAALCTSTTQFSGLLTETGNLPSNFTASVKAAVSNSSYTNGTFTRTKSYKLIAASFPETSFRSFVLSNGYDLSNGGLIWDGAASFTKAATHSWTVGITTTVSRV